MTPPKVTCTVEDDGLHLHEYRSGISIVTEHLHTWIDEHLTRWPDSSRVYLGADAFPGTVAEAWAELTTRPLPEVHCKGAS